MLKGKGDRVTEGIAEKTSEEISDGVFKVEIIQKTL